MTRILVAITVAIAFCFASPSLIRADQTDKRLDLLFSALKLSDSVDNARVIESQIWEVWAQTSDEEPAMLYEMGTFAMANRDFVGAIESFTQLVEIAPEFAEAWNKRATVYYLTGQYELSIEDIRQTLVLEPRHFGALSGLGLIMMRLERPAVALKSFEAAIELHPHMPSAKAHIEMLADRVDGEPL